ncbi:3-isopropylmalate dehydratase small subunit [Helicobacter sp.]|uniref:3-isopropylmalate dehydratase small subunit n=1 Tax=Helicobacter sp. TaxID=218 RepID=UPI0025BF9A4D|nr:3-isopropylmalate dehydratase small subunit [Helicobacter sp.]MBR2494794.1 3-isopropylmalate dehydratase small subunit [Helicobacter sp.]
MIQERFIGKVWRFGENIDTDVIIAARYLNTSDESILARHIMEDARAGFADIVANGDIIVADENFGCGSSREHAPLALKAAGIACVIAPSFARIFYRNAFNMGLLILECDEVGGISEGDKLAVDVTKGEIINQTTSHIYHFKPIPEFMLELLKSGGLIEYAKKQL